MIENLTELNLYPVFIAEELAHGLGGFIAIAGGQHLAIFFQIDVASFRKRIYEFGVAKAIGTTPGRIILLVLFEALFLALIACAIGLVIGYFAPLPPKQDDDMEAQRT